jgi:hypothetical protein
VTLGGLLLLTLGSVLVQLQREDYRCSPAFAGRYLDITKGQKR